MSRQFGGFGHARQQERARLLIILGGFLLIIVAGGSFYLISGPSPLKPAPEATVVVQKPQPQLKTVNVIIPLQKIESGTELQPVLFRLEQRPELGLSSRAVKGFDDIKGCYSRSVILPGEPLIADLITPVRPTNALTANIPPGMRAVTISVNATSSVEGWALPGAKVDVVWASRIRGQPGVTVIVQNAKILSAERQLDPNSKPGAPTPNTVTLLVSADDSTRIQLAMTTGSLSLSLRGDGDPGAGTNGGSITVDQLLGGNSQPALNNRGTHAVTIKVKGKDGKDEEMVFDQQTGKLLPVLPNGGG